MFDQLHSAFRPWLVAPVPKTARVPLLEGRSYTIFAIATIIVILCIYAAANGGSLGSGQVADKMGFLLILLSVRNLPVFSAFAISFDKYIEIHKILGSTLLIVFIIHASHAGWRTTGVMMAVLLGMSSLLYITVKKLKFELFYYPHIALYLIVVPIAFIHGATTFGLGILVWLADLVARYYLRGRKVKASLTTIGKNVVHVEFTKAIDFSVVHPFEAHPFSIAAGAHCSQVSFYIKQSGDWTQKLYDTVAASEGGRLTTTIYCEGPYGSRQVGITTPRLASQVLLLVAGGIGITPIISILQDVIHKQTSGDEGTLFKKIILVWTVRDLDLAQHVYEKLLVPLLNKIDNREMESLEAESKHDFEAIPDSARDNLFEGKNSSDNTDSDPKIYKKRVVLVGGPDAFIELVLHMSHCKTEVALETLCSVLPSAKKTTNGCRCGRPALKKLMKETAAIARGLNVTQVGVVTCGPADFIREVRANVEEYRQPWRILAGKVYFDYHEELFTL